MDDFSRGAGFVFRGTGEFFRHPKLWRFVALPFLAVLAVYALLYYAALEIWLPGVLDSLRDFFADSWFSFLRRTAEILVKAIFYLFLTALTAFFAGNLFEIFGCIGFARMVRCYETEILGYRIETLPLSRSIRNFAAGDGLFHRLPLRGGLHLGGGLQLRAPPRRSSRAVLRPPRPALRLRRDVVSDLPRAAAADLPHPGDGARRHADVPPAQRLRRPPPDMRNTRRGGDARRVP